MVQDARTTSPGPGSSDASCVSGLPSIRLAVRCDQTKNANRCAGSAELFLPSGSPYSDARRGRVAAMSCDEHSHELVTI